MIRKHIGIVSATGGTVSTVTKTAFGQEQQHIHNRYRKYMSKQRNIGKELIEAVRAIKNGEGKHFVVHIPDNVEPKRVRDVLRPMH